MQPTHHVSVAASLLCGAGPLRYQQGRSQTFTPTQQKSAVVVKACPFEGVATGKSGL